MTGSIDLSARPARPEDTVPETFTVHAHDAVLEVETWGNAHDPGVLLLAGTSCTRDWWPPRLCARLVSAGLFVVRFDQRDTGARVLPGIPTAIVYAMAGLSGIRLATFLMLNILGALGITGIVAVLGYQLRQNAVDAVLVIDRYASVVSLTLIGTTFLIPWMRQRIRRARGRARA